MEKWINGEGSVVMVLSLSFYPLSLFPFIRFPVSPFLPCPLTADSIIETHGIEIDNWQLKTDN